ncbi:FHA domain-containing protein [Thermochromatium tepidum]|uniref:FHA domain-containing protein n=1 Tax=Thermochromatium tepidum TaxID=1050 RepID=UPI00138A078A|nr:FHA domain-containing protein [Thermochromatium tepidum]
MTNTFILKSLDGNTTLHLQQKEYVVGRGSNCDGIVAHNNVSRRHALFRVTPEGVTVQDLGSTNGTAVNNQRIARETQIRPGDVITLGTISFCLMVEKDPNETVLMQNLSGVLKEAENSFVEEVISIGGETIIREKFPTPPGWVNEGEDVTSGASRHRASSRAVEALLTRCQQDPNNAAALVVLSGAEKSRVVCLAVTANQQRWTIGRDHQAQIQFTDPGVSRHHAELIYEFGIWRIENKSSKNPVLVNGSQMPSMLLNHRDEINLGGVLMVFFVIDRRST